MGENLERECNNCVKSLDREKVGIIKKITTQMGITKAIYKCSEGDDQCPVLDNYQKTHSEACR